MKKMRKILALFLVLVMIVALAGCGSSGAKDEGKAPADEKIKIGVTLNTLSENPTYTAMYAAMEARAAELGAELLVAEIDSNMDKLITAIEQFVNAGCQAIIVSVVSVGMDVDVIQPALDAGCFLIAFENDMEECNIFCGADNYETGKVIGKNAADWINANYGADVTVEVAVQKEFGNPIGINRGKGIEEVLAAECPNVTIVDAVEGHTVEEGVTNGENLLQAHPDLKVVCCVNDPGAIGIIEAFTAAGVVGEDIGIFGCDLNDQAKEMLQDPDSIFRATVSMDLNAAGVKMIEACVAGAKGETVTEDIPFDRIPVDKTNIGDFVG